jgi:hypothetical protein
MEPTSFCEPVWICQLNGKDAGEVNVSAARVEFNVRRTKG